MAITSAQQSAVFKLAVGLFNAAPGGFYNSVAGMLLSSKDAAAAADLLIATDAFQSIIPSNLLTNDQFAARLVQNLVGDTATQANKDWAAAAILGQLNSGKTLGEAAWWAIDGLSNVPTSDANWGAAAATLLNKIAVAQHFTVESPVASQNLATLQGLLIDVTSDAGTVAVAKTALSNNINLSTTVETTNGTSGADTFKAFLAAGANTLQSGDVIRGGAGSDTLLADISTQGNGGENAITFETNSVEKITLRAQHATNTANNGDNNLAEAKVAVDGERAAAVQTWHNFNSRADLIIEDVRIADGAKTKDVTIVMESTDPGNADFGVYFDQHSLRNSGTGTTTLTIRLMDTGAAGSNDAAIAAKPLLNNPYDQFRLGVNGTLATIQLDKTAVAAADTYEQLLTVFQNALASTAGVTVSLGSDFSITDPISNKSVTGKEIVLTGSQGITISSMSGSGWFNTTGASVPPTSNIYTTYADSAINTTELVTSTIVLDDVGRGSTGGDLVVGGLSVGATSTSRGVERFEIEVRDNSKLQTINSTNDSLREVTIKNGFTTNTEANQGAYDKAAADAGNLTVNGNANVTNAVEGQTTAQTGSDTKLPGLDDSHHGSYGFTDVRLIDGSDMTGKLAFNAQVTSNSINKYVTKVDAQGNPVADVAGSGNVNYNVKGANFVYSGGANNDTMSVVVDGDVAASRLSGRHDFTFELNGGAGNDSISVDINSATASANWIIDQRQNANVTINAGDGDDTVRTPGAGAVIINAGSGNDTVYTDNEGSKATWVVNAAAGSTDVADLQGSTVSNQFLYKGQLVVALSESATAAADSLVGPYSNGFEVVVDIPTGTNYTVNQLYLNQAIKAAINGNAVLSKLLVAQDGPSNTLTITSLIDGVFAANDLSLTVRAKTLTSAEEAEALSALKLFLHDSTKVAADVSTQNGTSVGLLNAFTGFSTAGAGAGSVLGTAVVDVAAVTESVSFAIGALAATESITVNGLTITAGVGGALAAQVEQALETGATVGTAVVSGSYGAAYTVGVGAAGTVTYTSVTAGANVADLASSDSASTGTITATYTQGAAATTTTATLTGSATTNDTDNTIDLGAGSSDVLVLSTSANAQEVVKFTGYGLGNKTVVNFDDAGASQDKIDFTAYLTSKSSASGSVESQLPIAVTVTTGATNGTVDSNEVTVLTGAGFDDTVAAKTFAGLTEAKLLAAINSSNTGSANYANIADATLHAVANQAATAVVGGAGASVVMIENNQNLGEYAVFELTWNAAHATSTDFTAAKLIGYVDFGHQLTITTADLVGF